MLAVEHRRVDELMYPEQSHLITVEESTSLTKRHRDTFGVSRPIETEADDNDTSDPLPRWRGGPDAFYIGEDSLSVNLQEDG